MSEYITKAFALGFKIIRENDRIYDLFTENFGRLSVVAPSSSKTLSRLAGHLVIGNLLKVKVVEKNTLTIVDALTLKSFLFNNNEKFLSETIITAYVLKSMSPIGVPDRYIWNFLLNFFRTQKADFRELLSLLGYNIKNSTCSICKAKTVFAFNLYDQTFLCDNCSFNFPKGDLLYI